MGRISYIFLLVIFIRQPFSIFLSLFPCYYIETKKSRYRQKTKFFLFSRHIFIQYLNSVHQREGEKKPAHNLVVFLRTMNISKRRCGGRISFCFFFFSPKRTFSYDDAYNNLNDLRDQPMSTKSGLALKYAFFRRICYSSAK